MNRDTPAPSRSLMDVRAIHKSRAAWTEWWFHNFVLLGSELRKCPCFWKALCPWEGLKSGRNALLNSPPVPVFCCCITSCHKRRGLKHSCFFSHGSCGSRMQEKLGWVLGLSSQEAVVRMAARAVFPSEGSAREGSMSPFVWLLAAFSSIPWYCSLSFCWFVGCFCWLLSGGHCPQLPTMQVPDTWTSPIWPCPPSSQKWESLVSLLARWSLR